ncbi:carbonic anhydrase [Allochromatium vinosum]|uniref:Carbonic anhydrase n=1 Tax=Allochromatium vinosum (strain ATCC 17899 / DSM 180 / NBRC 103801 / NCIMB 10441 / D) TaxID=572477 RepID=D3RMF0_ALLVD|nr:carbonic anhydrase [Allochromatium vinosum]ADC61208.1 carbonic anhydrase [Allochromatium vinosum DSM 180]MBK1655917.1 carbonic anhydrase [Allochromatium vinosum]
MPNTISALEALDRLREGNQRFAQNLTSLDRMMSYQRRAELTAGQKPFAIILGCSDSRAPAEILFDQGLGDLFVIRVAGNVVAPSQIGSVEFAVSRYNTRLVVVLGHSHCGAVSATIETLLEGEGSESRNIASIVDRVKPSVQPLLDTDLRYDREALRGAAVRANVRASANQLRHGSRIIESLIESDGLLVVGAEYALETGRVDFFDGVPDA